MHMVIGATTIAAIIMLWRGIHAAAVHLRNSRMDAERRR